MNEESRLRCENMLLRLNGQIHDNIAHGTLSLERLPAAADAVRTYIEAEVMFAQAQQPTDPPSE